MEKKPDGSRYCFPLDAGRKPRCATAPAKRAKITLKKLFEEYFCLLERHDIA